MSCHLSLVKTHTCEAFLVSVFTGDEDESEPGEAEEPEDEDEDDEEEDNEDDFEAYYDDGDAGVC